MLVGLMPILLGIFAVNHPERIRDWEKSSYAGSGLAFRLPIVSSAKYPVLVRVMGVFFVVFGVACVLAGLVAVGQ